MPFPIQQVPIPGRPEPIQLPREYFQDPSQIILAAAHLNNEREAMKQKQLEDFSNTIMAASGLLEKKRESEAQEAHAGALLQMQQQMTGPHMEEITANVQKAQAEAAQLQSQADLNNLFTKLGAPHPTKTFGPGEQPDPNKPPDNMPPMMWDYMVKAHNLQASYGALRYARGPLGQAAPFMQMMHSRYFPYDDMNKIEAGAAGEKAQASATGTLVGGKVESAVRAEGNIQATLNNMKTLVPKMDSGQIGILNRIKLGVEQDTGNQNVNLLNSFAMDAMKEMPQLFPGNTGSDFQAMQSMHMLNTAKSPQQLLDSINQIQLTAHDRSRAWQKLPVSSDIIRQANGDPDKARQALSDAGYQF